jgi:hypothetical protein
MQWLRTHLIETALFLTGLAVFALVTNTRLKQQSSDPHFVYLADAWLHGKLAIDPPPKKGDDWAKLEKVELDDGTVVEGRHMKTRRVFRTTGGDEIARTRVKKRLGVTHHVSFPPAPALLMLPGAVLSGRQANDVIPTVLIAALILPLLFMTLRRLAEAGLSRRERWEDVLLSLAFGFGTVLFFSSVQGRVWFTAHVFGVALAVGYCLCSIEARRPFTAGLLLGLAALTRAPMAFMVPLFVFEAWRQSGGNRGDFQKLCLRFAAPVAVLAVLAMAYNLARWGQPLEFGHSYLAVRQQQQMETWGMFNLHYLSRNLAVAGALLPQFSASSPFVSISGHGLAIWFTTPLLFLLLWPKHRGPLHRPLWITVACVALPSLLYQNSGWLQFGYRFSLDYMVLLFLLLAVGGRPFRRLAKALIVVGIVVNLFGAITFDRFGFAHYKYDPRSYSAVIAH